MAEQCAHRDKATTGRLTGRITDADTAVDGMHVETVVSTCTGCGELVVETELRRTRNTPPLFASAPTVLHKQRVAGSPGWSL